VVDFSKIVSPVILVLSVSLYERRKPGETRFTRVDVLSICVYRLSENSTLARLSNIPVKLLYETCVPFNELLFRKLKLNPLTSRVEYKFEPVS